MTKLREYETTIKKVGAEYIDAVKTAMISLGREMKKITDDPDLTEVEKKVLATMCIEQMNEALEAIDKIDESSF